MQDVELSYKYALRMPIQRDNIKSFSNKLYTERADSILAGKQQLFISPLFNLGTNNFLFQPIFDFDGRKGGGILKAYDDASTLAERLSAYPHIFEVTEDGVHLVFLIALYDIQDMGAFRNILKTYLISYNTIDIPATIKDMPIYRMGSYRTTYTMAPYTKLEKSVFNDVKDKIPLEIYSKEQWIILWKKYLFPQRTVSVNSFVNRLKE